MAESSLFYYGTEVAVGAVRQLTLTWTISGALTFVESPISHASILVYDGSNPSQADIDAFLGTSGEFDATAFDSAAIGPGATTETNMGLIVNMAGQAKSVHGFEFVSSSSQADLAHYSVGTPVSSLTVGDITPTNKGQIQVGSQGNIALKGKLSNFNTLNIGSLFMKIYWQPK